MDRAAIGLGGVFLHLRAELNFHRLFEAAMEQFSVAAVAEAPERGARSRGAWPLEARFPPWLSTAGLAPRLWLLDNRRAVRLLGTGSVGS